MLRYRYRYRYRYKYKYKYKYKHIYIYIDLFFICMYVYIYIGWRPGTLRADLGPEIHRLLEPWLLCRLLHEPGLQVVIGFRVYGFSFCFVSEFRGVGPCHGQISRT